MASLLRLAVAWLLLSFSGIGSQATARPAAACIPSPDQTTRETNRCDRALDAEPPAATATVPLNTLTNRFNVIAVTELGGITTWETPDAILRFFDGSRRLEFNGTLLWMNGATTTNTVTNTLAQAVGTNTSAIVLQRTIAQADVETVLIPLLSQSDPSDGSDLSDRTAPFIVILDPGHGGEDPGAVVADLPPEKTLVLDVARRVRRRLTAAGIEVRMTRAVDKTLTLAERPEFARRRHGSVLVSIHANKAPSIAARGIETFVMPAAGFPATAATVPVAESFPGNRHDAASLQLAYFLHRELIDQTQTIDRGVKRARFEVLRLAPCPAALVEIGFLSNASERAQLASPDYRDRLADGIAHGIRIFMLQNCAVPPAPDTSAHHGNGPCFRARHQRGADAPAAWWSTITPGRHPHPAPQGEAR